METETVLPHSVSRARVILPSFAPNDRIVQSTEPEPRG